MSYVFFQNVLDALGKKLNYECVSNMLGRTVLDKKAGDSINKIVDQANPLSKPSTSNSASVLMAMPSTMTVIKSGSKDQQMKKVQDQMGDTSWFEDYIKF